MSPRNEVSFGCDGRAHTVDGSSTAQDFTTGDENRLTSDEQYSYTYDNEGNLTRRDSLADSSYTTYAWNHRNQLTAFDQYNSSGSVIASVDYWYNATGELVYRRSGGANKEYYAYSGGRRAFTVERDNGTGSYDIAARYAYGAAGEPLMDQLFHTIGANQGEMSDQLFPLGDHQHSTRLVPIPKLFSCPHPSPLPQAEEGIWDRHLETIRKR